MGKPNAATPPPQVYRDDPDAVSMHTTRSDYEYDDVPELPSYSDSEAAATSTSAQTIDIDQQPLLDTYASIPTNNNSGWLRYSRNKLVTGHTTTIRMDERLNDPEELHNYITKCLQLLPPKMYVRVHGHHNETVCRNNKKETNKVVDFDFRFSMADFLPTSPQDQGWQTSLAADSDRAYRGSWRKTQVEGHKRQDAEASGDESQYINEGGVQYFEFRSESYRVDLDQRHLELMRWIREYCDSKAKLKLFRITREVTGLNTEYLRKEIEQKIRSTNYRGHISVTFPIEDKHVDIYNPHWANQWRISWVRYIFYLTFLWIFAWPILFFMTKCWEVYRVNW